MGENTNCMIENEAIRRPKVTGDGPNSSAYSGRIGMTMPKPTRSMNTIRKTMPIFARCSFKPNPPTSGRGAFYTHRRRPGSPPRHQGHQVRPPTRFLTQRRKRSSRWPDPAAYALEERRPLHSPPSFHDWEESAYHPSWGEARRNRRASGASAGGTFGRDKRSRLERTNISPAVGDRQIAGCSAVNRRLNPITSATISLHLCPSVVIFGCSLAFLVSWWFFWTMGGCLPAPKLSRE